MNKIIYIYLLTFSVNLFSQGQKEVCDTPEQKIDLNSIAKCTIKSSKKNNDKKTRQISVKISAPKRRFLKKRKKGLASEANNMNASGISTIENTTSISKSVKLKTNLAALTNTLSKEEVRSASKFNTVDMIPAFPECEGENGEDQLDCFNAEMIKHIQEHFRYPNEALINKIQGEVWVRFIIGKDGNVTNIKALGPKGGKILKDEAIRVVSNLPKFTPSVKEGKTVSVKYGFPINFSLEDN